MAMTVIPYLAYLVITESGPDATNTQLGVAAAFFWMSQILLISIAGPPLVGRRGLHDRIAGTRVRAASDLTAPECGDVA